MLYANMWAKNGDAVATWKSLLDEELQVLNIEAARARRSDTSNRQDGSPENTLSGQP